MKPSQVVPVPGSRRPAPRLTVVIVNFNSWPDSGRLVAALARTPEVEAGDCEVVVVDNASEDPAPPDLASQGPGVRVIIRSENGGFAAGVNTGWEAARASWILLLNPDVVLSGRGLAPFLARIEALDAEADDAPGIVGFGLRNPDGSRQHSVGTFPSFPRMLREQLIPRPRRKYQPGWRVRAGTVDWVTGACLLVDGKVLDALGGMDEDFFLYYEEVALCRSARNLGWRVEYDPTIEIVHLHPLQNRAISPRMRVITRHSKLLYFRKHLSRWHFRALSAVVLAEGVVREATAKAQGRVEEARSWRAIAELARAFRTGIEPRGRDVLRLADSVASTCLPEDTARSRLAPPIVPAGKRRGAPERAPLQPRKDGPACR